MIGKGQTGRVCEVHAGPASAEYAKEVESLVVKISEHVGRMDLAREARLYMDMHSLQGSVVPRCYGYFEAGMPRGTRFMSPVEDRESGSRMSPHWLSDQVHPLVYNPTREICNWDLDYFVARKIGVLVLEKLSSERLPLGRAFTDDEK